MDTIEQQNEFFQKAMDFSRENLDEELVKAVSELAYFTNLLADATERWLVAKTNRERTEAKANTLLRHQLIQENGKTTEKQVDNAVRLDQEFCNAQEEEIMAQANLERLKKMVDCCRAKKDVLVSLCGLRRSEMDNALSAR